ncbi:MAG: EAL domain-containing protein, partial [Campylobacterota bacterium]|nr:EAL domain-containing protein [Campylobacterota bacterium]
IHNDIYSRDIVETMQNFASKLGIKTVAEFVHCQEVLDVVNEIGIDYTQGYHISEPKAYIEDD